MHEAVVIVVVRRGQVLVIRRAGGVARAGFWSPPSGRVEPGETAAQAVVREAMEELGLEVTPRAQVWTCSTDDGRYRLLWWLCDATEVDPVANTEEVAEWGWIDVDAFADLQPTFASHRHFFAEILPRI